MTSSSNSNVGPAIRRTIFDGFIFSYLALVVIAIVLQPGEESYLELKRNTTIFFGLLVVGAVVSALMAKAGIRTLGEVLFAPPHRRVPHGQPKAWFKTFWGIEATVVTLLTFVVGCVVTKVSIQSLLDVDHITALGRLLGGFMSPDWGVLPEAVSLMVQTVYLAFVATFIAVPIAFLLSFVSAKNIMGRTSFGMSVYVFFRFCFNLSRSIEPLVWAIIFSVWVGIGPFAGMLALMIHSVSSLAKQYSEYVESVEEGPVEGIRSTGANTVQTVWFAIVPQVVLPYISYTIYRWDTNVRMATVIGMVGGGGIGDLLIRYQLQSAWPQVAVIILVIAFVVWVMDAFSAYVREAIK